MLLRRAEIILFDIQNRIARANAKALSSRGKVCLIAVSKMQPIARIETILEQGHRIFGENKVQEASKKWPKLRKLYSDIELHLIGHLQTNKVKKAFALFNAIHTLDRAKLALKIANEAQKQGRVPTLFIQINTGEERQKSGIFPQQADEFIKICRKLDLKVSGLMVIPPFNEEPAVHFALLRKIAERNGIEKLSMGMSADFETAIVFGASHVRVGSAVFGTRIKPTY